MSSKNKPNRSASVATVETPVAPAVVESIPAPVTQKGSPRGGTIKGWQKWVREHPAATVEETIAHVNQDALKQGYTYVLTPDKLQEWKDKPASNGTSKSYGGGEPTMDELLAVRSTPYEGGMDALRKDIEDYAAFEARFAKLLELAETVGGLTKLGKAVAFWSKA